MSHALGLAPEVMFLLPLNFLGATYRADYFRKHEPAALFVITPRPSFGLNKYGKRGTDSNEYAWFYWGARWRGIYHPTSTTAESGVDRGGGRGN